MRLRPHNYGFCHDDQVIKTESRIISKPSFYILSWREFPFSLANSNLSLIAFSGSEVHFCFLFAYSLFIIMTDQLGIAQGLLLLFIRCCDDFMT